MLYEGMTLPTRWLIGELGEKIFSAYRGKEASQARPVGVLQCDAHVV